MSGKRLTALLAALVLGAGTAWAQNFGAPVDRYFRLGWEAEQAKGSKPRITGYLYNDRGMWAMRVRLLVEALDGSGRTVSKTRDYLGDVPPGGRAYFDVTVPEAEATYRVSVEYFDWVSGPSG